MNEKTTTTRPRLGAPFREVGGEECKPPTFALATEIDRAIDLSCRACDACGAMAMGAGLGFPVGDSATLRFPPPTSDVFQEIIREVFQEVVQGVFQMVFQMVGWLKIHPSRRPNQ